MAGEANTQRPKWYMWLAALVTLGVVGAGLFFGIRLIVRTFQSLDKSVAAAIVSASAVVLAALVSVLLSRYYERKQAADLAQQAARTPVYEDFVKGLLNLLDVGKPEEERGKVTEAETLKVVADFTEKIIIWGSDDVIRAWVDWRYSTIDAAKVAPIAIPPGIGAEGLDAASLVTMLRMEHLLLTFRKDLGLSNKKLKAGDILRLWINDLTFPTG